MIREIQKYHDGRYMSVDAVYLCGEIGNPNKERLFVPFDKVMEVIKTASNNHINPWDKISGIEEGIEALEGDHFRDATKMIGDELTVEDVEAFLAEYDEQEEMMHGATKWTPCSEALPKIGEEVLVTRRFLGASNLKPYEYVTIAMLIFIDKNGYQNWVCDSDKYRVLRYRHTLPIAWMPLPKPYQGGQEGGEQE